MAILEAAGCDVVPLLRPIARACNLLGMGPHGFLLVHVVRGAWPEMLGVQSLGIPPQWPASTGRLIHGYTDDGSSPEVRLLWSTCPAIACPPSPPKAKSSGVLTLSAEGTPPGASPDGVRAPARGSVLASRLCPVCQKVPIHDGQEAYSGRCRAARSWQRKADTRRERGAEIRALLEAALEKLTEDP